MLNRKGQALVEFVLVLPVFLMILFVIVDFGMIFNAKSSLENTSNDIILMIQNGEDVSNISSLYDDIVVDIKMSEDGKYYTILVKDSVNLNTPLMDFILEDPYPISVKRVIPYEETR